jgi:hypothetical protein
MLRRLNHGHSLGAGVLVGLLLSYRPWIVFAAGLAVGILLFWSRAVVSRYLGRRRPQPAPEGYRFCANPSCRAPMQKTRAHYCSDACRAIVRQRRSFAAWDDLSEAADTLPEGY